MAMKDVDGMYVKSVDFYRPRFASSPVRASAHHLYIVIIALAYVDTGTLDVLLRVIVISRSCKHQ
jgi:hypothetical protein